MKKLNLQSFLAGTLTAALLFTVISTALAASGSVTFNAINLTKEGKIIFNKDEDFELASGEKVPSSILYVDQTGGGTTYLPMRYLAELLGISVTWDQATGTIYERTGGAMACRRGLSQKQQGRNLRPRDSV